MNLFRFKYTTTILSLIAALVCLPAPLFAADPPRFGFPPGEEAPGITVAADTLEGEPSWGVAYMKIGDAVIKNSKATGKGVKVAILDNGCDVNHPVFAGKIKGIYNATTKQLNRVDPGSHGTHVAHTVLQVAPECEIFIVQVLAGNSGSVVDIAHGIDYATTVFKVDVINMSLGGPSADSFLPPALKRSEAAGVLNMAAAGNDGPRANTDGYPARYPETISIAAHDQRGSAANFSSRGQSVFGSFPGVDILAAWPNNRLAAISGTSMACPHAAGVAACWISANPNVTKKDRPAQFRKELAPALSQQTRDTTFGWGKLDATKLIKPADATTPPVDPVDPVKPAPVVLTMDDLTPTGKAKILQAGLADWSITLTPANPAKPMPSVRPSAPVKPLDEKKITTRKARLTGIEYNLGIIPGREFVDSVFTVTGSTEDVPVETWRVYRSLTEEKFPSGVTLKFNNKVTTPVELMLSIKGDGRATVEVDEIENSFGQIKEFRFYAKTSVKPVTLAPLGVSPGPQFQWRELPGIGFGWVQDGITSAPTVSPLPQAATLFPRLQPLLPPMLRNTCPGGVCLPR